MTCERFFYFIMGACFLIFSVRIHQDIIPRKNMKLLIEKLSFKKYIRKRIKTSFSVLKVILDLENIVLRSFLGLICDINQRILAYKLRHIIKLDLKVS